ncbi:MAG: lamin tail domain-containing protein [Pyrinomonadaceae bacterium]
MAPHLFNRDPHFIRARTASKPQNDSLRCFGAGTLSLILFVQILLPAAVLGQARSAFPDIPKHSKKKRRQKKKKTPTNNLVINPILSSITAVRGVSTSAEQPAKPKSWKSANLDADEEVQEQAPLLDIRTERIRPAQASSVDFAQLAKKTEKAKFASATRQQLTPAPGIIHEPAPPVSLSRIPNLDFVRPLVPSPAPAATFLAQEDGPKIGGSTFTIPPDTQGAVGLDKLFVNTNQNYRVQDKASGAPLSTVSADSFWASSGGTGFFDPRIVFDPYHERWILAVDSNSSSANSSIELGISDTSDPAGTYHLFRFIVGCANGSGGCSAGGEWADFPMIGFNKNWVAISMNMFSIASNINNNSKLLVLDYPTLLTGSASGTIFSGLSIGFCNHPAETYDSTEETLYLAEHISSAGGTYKLSTITGTPGLPTLNIGLTKTRPGGGWTQPTGDILPQNCVPGLPLPTFTCPASLRFIDVGDAQVRNNVVFRNGSIYFAQNIGLPAGGLTHVAVQWTKIDTAGNFVDGGRIDDPTATNSNGGKWYAYPSITINHNDDLIIGFTQFASDQFAAAGYAVRLHGDAAGTTRDPVIYKAGEDYYQKTFGGTRNRWGDYSATRLDPVDDRDIWTIQEYAQQRVGTDGLGSNDSRWGTFWAKVTLPAGPADLKISEFRLRGPNGVNDEYIEIYNNTDVPLTVNTGDGSAGYSVAASSGGIRFTIPNGTVIPPRGHFLGANSTGYSLESYPAGNGTTAAADATYTTDIPDNAGIALFNTANIANFALGTRLDAVGSAAEANSLYKEGTGYPPLTPFSINYAFYRDTCGKGGSITIFGPCPTLGLPKDSDNNAADFVFVDTNGTSAGAGQRLGAPGPENLLSPIQQNTLIGAVLVDSTRSTTATPNRTRDLTSDPANNSTFGTLSIRRRFVNNTGVPVTRLRFRIIDISTFPAPSGIADLRPRTSGSIMVSGINDSGTCAPSPAPCTITIQGSTLEQPPLQSNGGGFNSSLSAGTITLASPLAVGASINIQFLLGIQQTGSFKFFVNMEALP